MIIKVSDALRVLVVTPRDKYLSALEHPLFSAPRENLSHLADLVPGWLSTLVEDGSFIVIEPLEYEELPDELREHIEVVKY